MRTHTDTRHRLMSSIQGLVHARGYAAVGVEEICRRARVKKGSFYHFFPSKRDLMIAALEQRWQEAESQLIATALADDVPPLTRIERLFDLAATAEEATKRRGGHVLGCPFGNLAAEISATDEPMRREIDDVFRRFSEALERTLRDAVAAGELPRTTDVPSTAKALVVYFEGVRLLARTRNDPSLIRTLGRHAVPLAR